MEIKMNLNKTLLLSIPFLTACTQTEVTEKTISSPSGESNFTYYNEITNPKSSQVIIEKTTPDIKINIELTGKISPKDSKKILNKYTSIYEEIETLMIE